MSEIFDEDDFNWEGDEPDAPFAEVSMIELFDGRITKAKDGLYINSADLTQMIERDIRTYEDAELEDEASILAEFLSRVRLMIANRGPSDG